MEQLVGKSKAPVRSPDYQEYEESHHLSPPGDRKVKVTLPPLLLSLSKASISVEMVSKKNGSHAVITDSVSRPDDNVEGMSIAGSRERDITINGVSMMEVMRMKNVKDKFSRQDQKTVTKGRKKSSQTSTPSMAKKYLVL